MDALARWPSLSSSPWIRWYPQPVFSVASRSISAVISAPTRVYQVRVVDMDPELTGRSREVAVKILADRMPTAPSRTPFEPVEFDGLIVTPYVTDRGRMAYSLRATGIRAAIRPVSKDAA